MGAPFQPIRKPETKPDYRFIRFAALAVLFLLLYFFWYRSDDDDTIVDQKSLKWDEVAYIDEQGDFQLKEWRLQEFDKKMYKFEQAEQYALIAKTDGMYKCYHCNGGNCFLQKGMVWKYGMTRRGMERRYPASWLFKMNLYYQIQLQGTCQECLIEEKRKIVFYPLHQDNIVRKASERMSRPPGNKNDN